ncbi:hypothetical protein HPB51_004331 [Rhipicephalus microplus]|uniref:Uncharacterized protein n=1 Tax=Rhipicephalus microplus TaxID=6941 RepID=A0A9J6EL70_RHIMP|nr:hypothetical protein HPB51_004331 [Rhipicephalus microplus]
MLSLGGRAPMCSVLQTTGEGLKSGREEYLHKKQALQSAPTRPKSKVRTCPASFQHGSSYDIYGYPAIADHSSLAGLGGGYNERESVEYVEREESDSEYDDEPSGLDCLPGSSDELTLVDQIWVGIP